jgi:ligand-binding SRPBCC domain-containing protein
VIGGVEVEDSVHYALKLGILGQILHKMVVRAKLNDIFNYRQTALENLF